MGLPRVAGWEELLEKYFHGCRGEAFAWGTFDCGLFAAGALQAMTGVDVGAPFRAQKYIDAVSAVKAIHTVTATGSTIADVVSWLAAEYALLQWPGVLFAQRGDLVLFDGSEGPAAGVVSLNGHEALFVSLGGLNRMPVNQCKAAWRVR